MQSEKLLYKEGDKIPKITNHQLENKGYVRSPTRMLREKFQRPIPTSCDIEIQKQRLERLYNDKKDKSRPTTNPERIK